MQKRLHFAAVSASFAPIATLRFSFRFLFFAFFFAGFLGFADAQSGCPGCAISLPTDLAADTIFLGSIPPGTKGTAYEQDISFRLPKTTTPVAAIDSTTPPGLTITKFEILGIENMPPGLAWEFSKTVFETATETDGCIKICGRPSAADTFILLVKVKASVFFITQETAFPMTFVVAPAISTTDGFSMSNFEGCSPLTVGFTNNLPSGGQDGYQYEWNFGDSTTFSGENPPAHIYTEPGIYTINYHATVDTSGYILESFTVLAVECVDQLGLGAPDLYSFIKDADGAEIFNSQPDIPNAVLPHTFAVNLPLGEGNYELHVRDEDSGLKGSDDDCGTVSFNRLSNDTLVSGGFRVVLTIRRPVADVFSTDTIEVLPAPVAPTIMAPNGLETCAGTDSVLLVSSYGAGNQWFKNGLPIPGAIDFAFSPTASGQYSVRIHNAFDCEAMSGEVEVTIHPLPAAPVFENYNNRLQVVSPGALPAQYALQWFNLAAPIPGETGLTYCAKASGTYGLRVTDLETGCVNFYQNAMVHNPLIDCTIGTGEAFGDGFFIFPNPASGSATLRFGRATSGENWLRMFDASGKLVETAIVPAGSENWKFDFGELPSGIFVVSVFGENGVWNARLGVSAGR